MRQLSGFFLMKKEELSFGEADSQRRNPLGLSIKKYEYLWNSLYVKKYKYLWNRVVVFSQSFYSYGNNTQSCQLATTELTKVSKLSIYFCCVVFLHCLFLMFLWRTRSLAAK